MYWQPERPLPLELGIATWVIEETVATSFGPLPLVLSSEHIEKLEELAQQFEDEEEVGPNPYKELIDAIDRSLSIRVTMTQEV